MRTLRLLDARRGRWLRTLRLLDTRRLRLFDARRRGRLGRRLDTRGLRLLDARRLRRIFDWWFRRRRRASPFCVLLTRVSVKTSQKRVELRLRAFAVAARALDLALEVLQLLDRALLVEGERPELFAMVHGPS